MKYAGGDFVGHVLVGLGIEGMHVRDQSSADFGRRIQRLALKRRQGVILARLSDLERPFHSKQLRQSLIATASDASSGDLSKTGSHIDYSLCRILQLSVRNGLKCKELRMSKHGRFCRGKQTSMRNVVTSPMANRRYPLEVRSQLQSRFPRLYRSPLASNTVTVIDFNEQGSELTFTFQVRGVYFGIKGVDAFPLEARAEEVPIQYTPDEWSDLIGYLRPHAEDPDGSLAAWTKRFVAGDQDQTVDVLRRMLAAFPSQFSYRARETEGTQTPGETLRKKSGTCRDYAWLMVEALRRLGFASRFVSGYLYDAALDGGKVGMTGSGATHAWLQVFLPGAGWLDYDPTNQINAGFDLIPLAVARHPGQAIPLEGSWFGEAKDYLGMSVNVVVSKVGQFIDASEEDQHG